MEVISIDCQKSGYKAIEGFIRMIESMGITVNGMDKATMITMKVFCVAFGKTHTYTFYMSSNSSYENIKKYVLPKQWGTVIRGILINMNKYTK